VVEVCWSCGSEIGCVDGGGNGRVVVDGEWSVVVVAGAWSGNKFESVDEVG